MRGEEERKRQKCRGTKQVEDGKNKEKRRSTYSMTK
jgi:hypothetical protein